LLASAFADDQRHDPPRGGKGDRVHYKPLHMHKDAFGKERQGTEGGEVDMEM
jgi:hypothetical protein